MDMGARRLTTPLMRDTPQPQHAPHDRTTHTAAHMLASLARMQDSPAPILSEHAHNLSENPNDAQDVFHVGLTPPRSLADKC